MQREAPGCREVGRWWAGAPRGMGPVAERGCRGVESARRVQAGCSGRKGVAPARRCGGCRRLDDCSASASAGPGDPGPADRRGAAAQVTGSQGPPLIPCDDLDQRPVVRIDEVQGRLAGAVDGRRVRTGLQQQLDRPGIAAAHRFGQDRGLPAAGRVGVGCSLQKQIDGVRLSVAGGCCRRRPCRERPDGVRFSAAPASRMFCTRSISAALRFAFARDRATAICVTDIGATTTSAVSASLGTTASRSTSPPPSRDAATILRAGRGRRPVPAHPFGCPHSSTAPIRASHWCRSQNSRLSASLSFES